MPEFEKTLERERKLKAEVKEYDKRLKELELQQRNIERQIKGGLHSMSSREGALHGESVKVKIARRAEKAYYESVAIGKRVARTHDRKDERPFIKLEEGRKTFGMNAMERNDRLKVVLKDELRGLKFDIKNILNYMKSFKALPSDPKRKDKQGIEDVKGERMATLRKLVRLRRRERDIKDELAENMFQKNQMLKRKAGFF